MFGLATLHPLVKCNGGSTEHIHSNMWITPAKGPTFCIHLGGGGGAELASANKRLFPFPAPLYLMRAVPGLTINLT
jgi:hypothetical protein